MANWAEIAKEAGQSTDEQFISKISSLTRLNDDEIESLIKDTGISKKDLAAVLKEVKDSTKTNTAKAKAIQNISKGVDSLILLVGKLIQVVW